MSKVKKVLFYSRDPGGVNCVVPVYRKLSKTKGIKTELWGKDFAISRYREEDLHYRDVSDVEQKELSGLLKKFHPSVLVTGTSYGDRTEQWLWKTVGKLGIYSIAILDQWLSYRIRFSDSDGKLIFPDKILVMDELAKKEMIADGFDGQRILVTGQPHFETLREKAGKITEIDKRKIKEAFNCRDGAVMLFVSEPFASALHVDIGFTEHTVLRELISAIAEAKPSITVNLLVKTHPKQKQGEVLSFAKSLPTLKNLRLSIVTDFPALPLILIADVVIGIQSTVLVEANILNKPVMSIQIGRKSPDQFILSKRKVIEAVTTRGALNKELRRFFMKLGEISQKTFPVPPHPIENIKRFIISVSDQL